MIHLTYFRLSILGWNYLFPRSAWFPSKHSLNNSFRGRYFCRKCPTYEKWTLPSASFQSLQSSNMGFWWRQQTWVSKRHARKMKRKSFKDCSDHGREGVYFISIFSIPSKVESFGPSRKETSLMTERETESAKKPCQKLEASRCRLLEDAGVGPNE